MRYLIESKKRKQIGVLISFLCVSVSLWSNSSAQVQPVYDRGTMGLLQVLKRLNTSASAMMIGAHPDDEDTALLAYLARGENARTAYLSLTRGDGGQNIIGPELGEALGVIRTEELLQARRLDGAEQYFTRAYDYGFSKTLAEAQSKWPENIVLCDAVRAIREFRPLVVISRFSGTPADGHGQHQYSGYITPIAVKAAADATQCRNDGSPWKVKKLYVSHGFRATTEPRLRVNTGKYDPILGRSYFEIAMEARSQHKSQEQGVLELKGEMFSGLNLVGSEAPEKGIFDGLDTSVKGIARHSENSEEPFEQKLSELQTLAARALSEYDVRSPERILPLLTEGYNLAATAESSTRVPASKSLMKRKQVEFREAVKLAAGIQIDMISDKETVVPSETFNASSRVYLPTSEAIKVIGVKINAPNEWIVTNADPPTGQQQGFFRRENPNHAGYFNITAANNAKPTQPYWLDEPRAGEMFQWKEDSNRTLPLQPPVVSADITVEINGTQVVFNQPLEFRYADDTRGEIRRPLTLVPLVSLALDQDLAIIAKTGRATTRKMRVTVTNNSSAPVKGTILATPPKGVSIAEATSEFSLSRKGESSTLELSVSVPNSVPIGNFPVGVSAVIDTGRFSSSMRTLAYPHIQTQRIYKAASAKFVVLDVKTAPVKVGYIAGSGDRVPDAIRELGIPVETITPAELASGDLSKYDTIVVGIRAYQVRPDVVSNNKRLLDFANAGGTLIVQYQLPAYTQQNLAPFPAQQGPRTSDENAAVNILAADHPVMNFPNKITATDFEGWVQERNLYNFSTMDPKYAGLLESHDAGEAENKGGLVVADVGKGKYIYCSYSLFRQLPAGVPGAYRLLANMISLPKAR
jgi:LmbE family N-acetylglucosaminyl deacetylase